MTHDARSNTEYWCDAYCGTATAVANQIAQCNPSPDTFYGWQPINPTVSAMRKLYEGARYESGDYDLQMGHLTQTALVWKSGGAL